jgi:HK97 family phage major capsid protein
MAVDDVREQIDKGFKGLKEQQDEQKALVESEFEVLKRRMSAAEGLSGELKQTKEWITEVEAKVNTARTHGPGQDNLIAAIPQAYRKHIDIAERHGYKDPVQTAAKNIWWAASINAKLAVVRPGNMAPLDYQKIADDIERGWGYDPAQKALLGDALAGGGSVIATPVEAELMRLILDNTIVRPLATKIVMTSLTHQVPVENANVTAFIVAENATITDSMPATAFASRAITAKKFAGMATVTNELLQDNIIGLNEYLFTAIAEQIGRLEDIGAIEGGTAAVQNFSGIAVASGVNAFTVAATSVTGGNIPTYQELIQLVYTAQQSATRRGAGFFMTPLVFKNIVSLVDNNGQPIFSLANVPNAIPQMVGGYPVYLVSSLSTQWATVSGSTSQIYFGPPSKIIYGDATGMSFDIDPYFFFDTVKTRIRVLKRTGILVPVGAYFTMARGVKPV